MSIRSYRYNILADFIVHLLEYLILLIRICLQQCIYEIAFQDADAYIAVDSHTMLVIVFQMIGLLLFDLAGYIFGYCEKVKAFDHPMTDAERADTVAWETRQLEIMDWLTDDVDWMTGETHEAMQRLA